MKRILIFMVKNSNDNKRDIFNKKCKNKTLIEKDNKFFLKIHSTSHLEEIAIDYDYIKFDEKLYKELLLAKKISIQKAREISNEEMGIEIIPGSLEGIIYSEIFKASHESPSSIFYFCASLFIKILMGHKLSNGNKRVALVFLIIILKNFGYHLDWSKGARQNYKYYKPQVEKFVKKLENGYNKNQIREIQNWIVKHSTIDSSSLWSTNGKNLKE